MAKRPSYPRINCAVPGCKRGTTTFEPGTTMICGKCWRQAPKDLRDRYSYWRRKGNALFKRGDARADTCYDRADRRFHTILLILAGKEENYGDTMPSLMVEELRKLALI